MLIDNTEVTSVIQAASSQGRKPLKHRRWALRLSLEIHQQSRLTEASKFQEF